jgi:hypothetical protein
MRVVVKEWETGEIVHEVQCDDRWSAEKVDGGLTINLNHDKFYTEIVE